ncbi:DJ-1/PfpI family protein [Fodinicola acaciae]|uniref:DJ-1/PfpI family protein n=1 Tax=Fodinicola acaciae TaxID=2681555 RepID=UPI0013D64789|nr:DJ-1/PfpI family protein [Fodinicola acaciae]
MRGWRRFAFHYLEMTVAMLVGMAVLGGALRLALAAAGVPYSMDRYPVLVTLEMGVTMAVAMAVWMRVRRHGWPPTVEMSLAMLVPAVAVAPLVAWNVLDGMSSMVVEHTTMFVLMLVVMLRRRDEYLAHHHGSGRLAKAVRRVLPAFGRGLFVLLSIAILPSAAFAIGSVSYEHSRYAPAASSAVVNVAAPVYDPSKPTVAIVVGNDGANVADTLVPYAVLSATGKVNVYTVAAERRPVTLLGGLDLVPDLSFDQLRQRVGAPSVTIVPDMPPSDTADAKVAAWLRSVSGHGLVLGVCTGARLLAKAGLLDGRPATSHWYRLSELQHKFPAVNWQRGVRYLDDGDLITTGGLLSSVDGTLRVIERLLGTDAASKAATTVAWRYYSPGKPAALPVERLTASDAITHILNSGFRANDTTVGVVLSDGVDELDLAAAFDPYGEIKAARTLAISADGGTVRSRHGLTFVPRAGMDAAGRVDHLLIPRSDKDSDLSAARRAHVPVAYLAHQSGFAFDAALRELALTTDTTTAHWAAKILEYPSADLDLAGPGWPWLPTVRPALLGLTGLAIALLAVFLWRRGHKSTV